MITAVWWRDTTYQQQQHAMDELVTQLVLVKTVGTRVRETDEILTLALDVFEEEEPVSYRYIAHIPKVLIERRMDVCEEGGTCLR